jgi:IclR family transcriptional regulator, pca regulon regulatory protein
MPEPETPAAADLLFNQSLEKGLAVLAGFNARRRSMTLAEAAAAAGISKSSAQRMVHTLEVLGLVRKQAQTRRYELTPRVLQIGLAYLAADALIELANPFLAELARTTGETCNLTEPDGTEMVYVARFVSAKFVPIHMPIGSRIPMYCTGAGRAYLSALPEAEAQGLLQQAERVAHTRHTRTDVAEITALLARARRHGFATNREELFLGDMSIAVPIAGAQGRPLGAVHVVAPTSRWTLEEAEQRLAPAVIECARGIGGSARSLG